MSYKSLPVPCVLICFALNAEGQSPSFTQPALPYAYNALEPYIDAMTMEIHYSRHHAAYTKNFNAALQDLKQPVPAKIEEIFANISKYPVAVRNNGGGYYNHILFWESLSPDGGSEPAGKLAEAIRRDFGSVEAFKEQFSAAAAGQFGSGWAWLISNNGKLSITATPNQDNPLMDTVEKQGTPVLCLDVWEHAYYLKYQNKRPDYIQAFWNVVNWKGAGDIYEKTL
jgi:Fe-Mn family superoxide dismutase